jgi:hypothetical protein
VFASAALGVLGLCKLLRQLSLEKFNVLGIAKRALPRDEKMWNNNRSHREGRMPKRGIMIRTSILAIAFALTAATVAQAQFPAQPAPVASPMQQGTAKERDACQPDVNKFCQAQLQVNADDVLGILGCLQTNRSKISKACQEVLASHGQ